MFGIGSQQNDILEEQYKLKYLKYKEKYLKLKQSGGFGKTSSGIHCFLTNQTLANQVKNNIATYDLDALTNALHDNAYVVKDGTSEIFLVQKSSLFSKKTPLNHSNKIPNNIIMDRCNLGSARKIRSNILIQNHTDNKVLGKQEDVASKKDGSRMKRKVTISDWKQANTLDYMITLHIAALGKNHKVIGDVKQILKNPLEPIGSETSNTDNDG